MKLLENSKLDEMSSALCMDTGDSKITGRYVHASASTLILCEWHYMTLSSFVPVCEWVGVGGWVCVSVRH